MKAFNIHRHESGQILLILTVGIVALLGFLALAVDGGMIYADRRFDQNAADASSFAGAGAAAIEMQNRNINSNKFNCSGAFNADKSPKEGHILYHPINNAINAALQRAASNNFTIQYPLQDQHGVEIICVSSVDNYLEVRTVISSTVRTAFAHLFYKGEVRNTVEAVARAVTSYNINGGGSLTHLSNNCDTPLLFSGSSTIKIDGAYTNGCFRNNGAGLTVESSAPIYHTDMCDFNTKPVDVDDWDCPENSEKWPDFEWTDKIIKTVYLEDEHTQNSIPLDSTQVAEFWNTICGKTSNVADISSGRLGPGRYKLPALTGGKKLVLEGGLYCLDKNVDIRANATLESDGAVTIILIDGSLDINGKATVKLSAPKVGLSNDFDYPNLLFYGAKFNYNTHNFNGTGESYFDGSLWFPDGHVVLNGNGTEQSFGSTQVVANQITINGNNVLGLIYNENEAISFPSRVSLVK